MWSHPPMMGRVSSALANIWNMLANERFAHDMRNEFAEMCQPVLRGAR